MDNLNVFAEPIVASQLKEGEIYFMLNFFDDHLLVPHLRTVIYIGRDVTGENDGKLYFQDFPSYTASGAYPHVRNGTAEIISCADDQVNHVFEFDKAVAVLQQCAARRAKKPGTSIV